MSAKHRIFSTLALFSSFSTLFCCALPALFVSLGAGAALIGLVNAVPQLVWLSEHKIGFFIFAGCMLTLSGVMRYLNRNASCPADPLKTKSCKRLRRFSKAIFFISLAIYATGFYFAFIAQHLG
jgi:putative copper export protein